MEAQISTEAAPSYPDALGIVALSALLLYELQRVRAGSDVEARMHARVTRQAERLFQDARELAGTLDRLNAIGDDWAVCP